MLETTKMTEKGLSGVRIDCNYQFSYPLLEDDNVKDIELIMKGYNEKDEEVTIATTLLQVVPSTPYHAKDDDIYEEMFDIMDAESDELALVAQALCLQVYDYILDEVWFALLGGEIVHIDSLIVEKEYRGLGTESILVENIENILRKIGIETGLITAVSSQLRKPYLAENASYEEFKKVEDALEIFYEENKFKCYDRTQKVMAKIL